MSKAQLLGNEGEELAVSFLVDNNYIILERNYRFGKAEVDIIALKEKTLAVIEVKTRSSNYFGNPQEFVKPKQIKQLINAINHYIIENNLEVEVRFDIVGIIKNARTYKLEHIKDAFYHF